MCVSVGTHTLYGLLFSFQPHLDIWIAEVSGTLLMRVRAFKVPRGGYGVFPLLQSALLF